MSKAAEARFAHLNKLCLVEYSTLMELPAIIARPLPLGRLNEGTSDGYLSDPPVSRGERLRRGLLLVVVAALHMAGLQLLFRLDYPVEPRVKRQEVHVVLVAAERTPPLAPERSAPPRESRRSDPVEEATALPPTAPMPAPVPRVTAPTAPPIEVPLPSRQLTEQKADAPPAPVANKAVSPSWAAKVASWVQRHKSYPEMARARHEQGDVCVRVTVTRDGSVVGTDLTCSSGSMTLDAAARDLFQSARLPSFPGSMTQDETIVDLVLSYSIGS